jgi:hypothetical protein
MSASSAGVRDFLDAIFSAAELLSLTDEELVQLEEIEGDLALTAAWSKASGSRDPRFGYPMQ